MKNKIVQFSILLIMICLPFASFIEPKELDIPEPGIYFKLNGTQKEFKQSAIAAYNKFANKYSLTIGASIQDAKGNDIDGVGITLISNQKDFSAGKSYSIDVPNAGGKNTLEIHTDIPNNPEIFWISSPGISGQEQLTVTITELTEQYVKGTFSGNVFTFPGATTNATITGGEFYVKFNQ